ncbi:glycoside hydrolase superfamily [Peziza echinospora]|nr:glycoside hydrolase superfamily [Peziza echinospora]
MYALAVCHPPLGATTVVEQTGKPIRFTAILELAEQRQDLSGEELIVELWYGEDGNSNWRSARFKHAEPANLTVINKSENRKQRHFELDLKYNKTTPLNYSIRFKLAEDKPWMWAKEHSSSNDGRIILWSPDTLHTFDTLFHGLSGDLTATPVCSQVPGVSIWNVSAPIGPHSTENCTLGIPTDLERFYALVKLSSPWMGPRQGSGSCSFDREALIMGYVRKDGKHVCVLGVSALDDCNTYITADKFVQLRTRNDGGTVQTHKAIVAMGNDWKKTVDAAFLRAREMVRASGLSVGPDLVEAVTNDAVDPQWRQEWFDGLAYCTWNGLGRELTEDRILHALKDLSENGIKVSTLIIDDNWQTLINRKWDKFEADPVMFPRGLKATVTTIKKTYPHIKHVAVWHAMFGYWDGIAPGGWIDSTYKTKDYKWHGGHDVRLVTPEAVGSLYEDFYNFLSSCGIDGVKTDVQASLDELDDGTARQAIGRAYQDAFKLSSLKYFGRKVIYCMAMQPFIYWHALISHDSPPAVFRNSDDFFPDIPDSHNWHIFANAMNTIFTARLNGLPDWDMFQSSLTPYGGLHAAARCISGGPIYVTDTPGSHDVDLIKRMSATDPRGNTVILRPDCVAQPTNPFVEYNSSQLLRVGNTCGGRSGTSSLLAAFNISDYPITEILTLNDFPEIFSRKKEKLEEEEEEGDGEETRYAIRAFSSGAVVGEVSTVTPNDTIISITLPSSGWEILTATRLYKIPAKLSGTGDAYIGTFGLTNNLAGAAAVLSVHVAPTVKSSLCRVTLKALGVLGFYVSDLAEGREVTDMLVTIWDAPVPIETVWIGGGGGVGVEGKGGRVVFVDVQKAWTKMGLSAGWSSQVEVTLRLD